LLVVPRRTVKARSGAVGPDRHAEGSRLALWTPTVLIRLPLVRPESPDGAEFTFGHIGHTFLVAIAPGRAGAAVVCAEADTRRECPHRAGPAAGGHVAGARRDRKSEEPCCAGLARNQRWSSRGIHPEITAGARFARRLRALVLVATIRTFVAAVFGPVVTAFALAVGAQRRPLCRHGVAVPTSCGFRGTRVLADSTILTEKHVPASRLPRFAGRAFGGCFFNALSPRSARRALAHALLTGIRSCFARAACILQDKRLHPACWARDASAFVLGEETGLARLAILSRM
jgi:hypothetical protein